MAKYLVCRTDALRPEGRNRSMINSSMFPIVVESDRPDREWIVRLAFEMINHGYMGMHSYLVVPLDDADVVTFRPKRDYEVVVDMYK